MYGFIYVTTNKINGKKYLGQRKYDKRKLWKSYLGSGTLLHKAFKKYGKENFTKEIIKEAATKDELNDLEEYYIKLFNCCYSEEWYNIRAGGSQTNPFEGMSEGKKEEWKQNLTSNTRAYHKNPFLCVNIFTEEIEKFDNAIDYTNKYGKRFEINETNENLKVWHKNNLLIREGSYYKGIVKDCLIQNDYLYLINIKTLEKKLFAGRDMDKVSFLWATKSLKGKRIIDGLYIVCYVKDFEYIGLEKLLKDYIDNEFNFQMKNGIILTDIKTNREFLINSVVNCAKLLGVTSKMVSSRLLNLVKSPISSRYEVKKFNGLELN